MDFQNYINPECILILSNEKKKEALTKLIDKVIASNELKNRNAIIKNIFYREELMSTGIGLGLAIPHIRYEEVQHPVIAVGIEAAGIEDYKSIDDQSVKIIIMIIVGKDQHKEHIMLLSQRVDYLKEQDIRDKLISCTDAGSIFKILTGEHA